MTSESTGKFAGENRRDIWRTNEGQTPLEDWEPPSQSLGEVAGSTALLSLTDLATQVSEPLAPLPTSILFLNALYI